jgi:hypothetical protein
LQSHVFPTYTIENGVATIAIKVRNGYIHEIKVPTDGSGTYATDALAFLKRCWPFEVTGVERKKLKRNGQHLAEVWARFFFSRREFTGKVRCKNHDWLDWTGGNLFFHIPNAEERQRKQATLERQNAFLSNRIGEVGLEILQTRKYGRDLIPIPYGTDPDVAEIFREAQMVPARRSSAKTPALDTESFNRKFYASDISLQAGKERRQRRS